MPAAPARRSSAAALCLALGLAACAGDLVVRASPKPPVRTASVLSAVAPLRVSVSPVAGAPAMDTPVGRRAGGWLLADDGPIYLTEDVGAVVRRVVVRELEAAGVPVVDDGGDVHLGLRLEDFRIDAPREGGGWEVTAALRLALRVSPKPGSDSWDEFEYSAERSARAAWPGVSSVERVLDQTLEDLGGVLAQRQELATALRAQAVRRP